MKKARKEKELQRYFLLGTCIIIIVFLLGLTGPISKKKAISLAKTYCTQGLYCSGYNYNKGDNTCIAVFRNKNKDNRIEKTITVNYETAQELYNNYGGDYEYK